MLYFGPVNVEVRTGGAVYQAVIGRGLIDTVSERISKKHRASRCAIITDSSVAPLYADQVECSLTTAGIQPVRFTIPGGEQSKTLHQVGTIADQMLGAGLDRNSLVIGLGGGVVGDISGFLAAIFHRGIAHVQIPTTLLAMVDSSIGGKTGVNTGAGKNLIGAVHPPVLVIDDVEILKTLPSRELSQGFAEIIKHAIIADAEMFRQLQDVDFNNVDFASLIRRNVEIKARIVANDERDRNGERALLNFGHTVGHGVERATNYQGISHGEAVGLGMVAACDVSINKAGLPEKQRNAIVDLLQKFELPT